MKGPAGGGTTSTAGHIDHDGGGSSRETCAWPPDLSGSAAPRAGKVTRRERVLIIAALGESGTGPDRSAAVRAEFSNAMSELVNATRYTWPTGATTPAPT
jgi:hypothetical protein